MRSLASRPARSQTSDVLTAKKTATPLLRLIGSALQRALRRKRGAGREEVHSDSQYAINMTTGRWRPRKKINAELIEKMREMWRHIRRARPGEVTLHHVRSHVCVPGNELADWLADLGKTGAPQTLRNQTCSHPQRRT